MPLAISFSGGADFPPSFVVGNVISSLILQAGDALSLPPFGWCCFLLRYVLCMFCVVHRARNQAWLLFDNFVTFDSCSKNSK